MNAKMHDDRSSPESESGAEQAQRDLLVERMFSGFGHAPDLPQARPMQAAEATYLPLRQSRASPGTTYHLQTQIGTPRVQADSPAGDVMTDFTRVAPVTTRPWATITDARQTMIAQSVRALLVVDNGAVVGVITASDVLGERPIQVAQQRGIRHDEVPVREVMTDAHALEAMDLEDVLRARVGDIVASLRQSGRQHALVFEAAPVDTSPNTRILRGIFSLTQIARQLGLPPQGTHDVARTFAEIEAVIGA
jgi:CBS domain-containing protein